MDERSFRIIIIFTVYSANPVTNIYVYLSLLFLFQVTKRHTLDIYACF
jgi:hypothetical protein